MAVKRPGNGIMPSSNFNDSNMADIAEGAEAAGATHPQLPVFLVGMPGAGKTTIGKALARHLQRPFLDLDHELERRCGVRIPTIFDLEGEAGFRRRETCALDECTRQPGIVLATGGGAVLAAENRRLLRERGMVVYLKARAIDLYHRTRHDRNRPLLQNPDPLGTLSRLLEQREPFYEEIADLTIETGRHPVQHVVRRVLPLLQTYSREPDLLCKKLP